MNRFTSSLSSSGCNHGCRFPEVDSRAALRLSSNVSASRKPSPGRNFRRKASAPRQSPAAIVHSFVRIYYIRHSDHPYQLEHTSSHLIPNAKLQYAHWSTGYTPKCSSFAELLLEQPHSQGAEVNLLRGAAVCSWTDHWLDGGLRGPMLNTPDTHLARIAQRQQTATTVRGHTSGEAR